VRVGIDVSPLVQTRAGTARHVLGLLGELSGRPGLELVGLEAGGTGRLASVRRDALWYPFRLGHASAQLDVLHCTTFRAPVSPRAPLSVTVHDLGVLPYPTRSPGHRLTGVARPPRAVRRRTRSWRSPRSRATSSWRASTSRSTIRVRPNGVDRLHGGGPVAEGDTCSRSARWSRERTFSTAVEATRLAGVELARRCGGWAASTLSGLGGGGGGGGGGSANRETKSSRR